MCTTAAGVFLTRPDFVLTHPFVLVSRDRHEDSAPVWGRQGGYGVPRVEQVWFGYPGLEQIGFWSRSGFKGCIGVLDSSAIFRAENLFDFATRVLGFPSPTEASEKQFSGFATVEPICFTGVSLS